MDEKKQLPPEVQKWVDERLDPPYEDEDEVLFTDDGVMLLGPAVPTPRKKAPSKGKKPAK